METDNKAARLEEMLKESENVVFFGGAGVSTESGIPDYRSVDGLYHQKFKYPPEVMLSRSFFERHTEEFYEFYKAKLLAPDAEPNAAHLKLAELERSGKLKAVVTQNVDGLHQKAGSENVIELHGSVYRNRCTRCGKRFGLEAVLKANGVPKCDCGGVIKPEVVLYEESLEQSVIEAAVSAIGRADMMIIGGTSLAVYPAAGLIGAFCGRYTVVINRDPTPADKGANLIIQGKIGEVLGALGGAE